MQKTHIIRCYSFSDAYDICTVLDCHEDIVYSVTTSYSPGKFDPGHFEYEIRYSYEIEGDE